MLLGPGSSKKRTWAKGETNLDFDSVERCVKLLESLPSDANVSSPLLYALEQLFDATSFELQVRNVLEADPNYVNLFLVALEFRQVLAPGEFVDKVCKSMCKAVRRLTEEGLERLARLFAKFYDKERLGLLVSELQQHVTGLVLAGEQLVLPGDPNVENAVVFMKVSLILFHLCETRKSSKITKRYEACDLQVNVELIKSFAPGLYG
jgi:hypothetical protein